MLQYNLIVFVANSVLEYSLWVYETNVATNNCIRMAL